MKFEYDIIVVGAGHAGCEAAYAAAKLGSKTLLVTMDMTKMAHMSCNPAMGGIAKGQIIREIDAMEGRDRTCDRQKHHTISNVKQVERTCHVESQGTM